MPTRVLDLDFEHIPPAITGLDGYANAMVLLRIGGKPVERVYIPVHQGQVDGGELRAKTLRVAGGVFWESWLRAILSVPASQAQAGPIPPATVAVCTRDRPQDLRRCLEALSRAAGPPHEILVVDSCSSGPATRQVVEGFPGVRYAREEAPGLDRARNRALHEANHAIVAFIDDDAVPDPGWLPALVQNFRHNRVACVTGLTMPLELETAAQECFERYAPFSRKFARKVYDWKKLHPIGAGQAGAGVNMALRRDALDKVGPFDEALDAGTPTRSGGETEMFSRLLAAGYQIVYDPSALNWHCHRRSWKELRRNMDKWPQYFQLLQS